VISAQSVSLGTETAFTKLPDGSDFPLRIPDGEGYYKVRGFRPTDISEKIGTESAGGDTDPGEPVYSIGTGIVVLAALHSHGI